MNYIDVAIIAIIALFALFGLWKGVAKTSIKLICFALSIVATYFIADLAMGKILSIGFINKLVIKPDGVSLASLYYKSIEALHPELIAESAPVVGGVFGKIVQPMIDRFTSMGGSAAYGLNYGEFVAAYLAINTLTIALMLICYGIVRIVAHLVAKILSAIFVHEGKPKAVSRIIGFIIGAVRGAAVVAVLIVMSMSIIPMKFGFAKAYTKTFDESLIGKKTASLVCDGYDALVYKKGNAKLEKLLSGAGYEKTEAPADEAADAATE